jgi:AraC family transcriptional regulator
VTVTSKALWYIESHIDGDLSLDAIARAAGVSRFHLSRAFAATAGLSLGTYTRARRLSEAAKNLSAGAPDILALALDSGYGSHEAFTRAFRQHFGVTPEQFRSSPIPISLQEPLRMNPTDIPALVPPRIVAGKAMRIFGIGEECVEAGAASIPSQWSRFAPYIGNIPGQVGDLAYGVICHPGDAFGYIYICGVEVKTFPAQPADFARLEIPPQTYAVFHHAGHVSSVLGTWKAIWEHGIINAGYQAVDGPSFELYGPEFDGATGLGGFDIWVPVAPPSSGPGPIRLSRAMVFVKDIARMTEFYQTVLGLKPIAATRLDNYVEFESGFSLHAIPAEIAQGIQIADPAVPREKGPTKLTFETPDLSREQSRLRSLGIPRLERPWGVVDWIDPEGNIFNLRKVPDERE